MSTPDTTGQVPQAVRVLHGRPDEAEVAALTAVVSGIVAARASADQLGGLVDEHAAGVRSRWTDHARRLRIPPAPSAGAWQWSLHP